jgi:broad specificity phosphatase PhoE
LFSARPRRELKNDQQQVGQAVLQGLLIVAHDPAARRGKGNPSQSKEDKTPEQRRQAMTWAQRLKRVFNIDVSVCPRCGGEARVIASIQEQPVIDKILRHLQAKGVLPEEILRV